MRRWCCSRKRRNGKLWRALAGMTLDERVALAESGFRPTRYFDLTAITLVGLVGRLVDRRPGQPHRARVRLDTGVHVYDAKLLQVRAHTYTNLDAAPPAFTPPANWPAARARRCPILGGNRTQEERRSDDFRPPTRPRRRRTGRRCGSTRGPPRETPCTCGPRSSARFDSLTRRWSTTGGRSPSMSAPRGLTTSAMPYDAGVFDIEFDFIEHRLHIRSSDGDARELRWSPSRWRSSMPR